VIGFEFIAVERRASLDVLLDFGLQRSLPSILDNRSTNLSASLQDTHYRTFVLSSSSGDTSLPLRDMHVPCFAADEGFINFDFSSEPHERFQLHSFPNPVKHEPRGFLRHAKSPRHFIGTDTVLIVGNHPHGGKPLVQAKRRILKDRPCLDSELSTGVVTAALPAIMLLRQFNFFASADRAGYAFRPATGYHVVAAVDRIRE